jgi:hypothetical protein
MTRFSGRRLAYPFLPDVPAERLKCSCSLVEPGLHLADLLELCVLTPPPPQGLGPQLALEGCQREAQAYGDHYFSVYQDGCLRGTP